MGETPQNTTFPLFPNLPPELRDKIWLQSLPSEPRLIPYAATSTPSVATVNRESRVIFLSVYTKCFLPGRLASKRILPYPISLYANLSHDTLFLFLEDISSKFVCPFPLTEWMTTEGIRGLKHVAADMYMWKTLHLHISKINMVESLTYVLRMAELYGMREGPRYVVEINEQHRLWQKNGDWWVPFKKGHEKEYKSLRMTLAEVVV